MTNLRSLYPQPSTGGIEILSFTQIFELTMYVCMYVHTHILIWVCAGIYHHYLKDITFISWMVLDVQNQVQELRRKGGEIFLINAVSNSSSKTL